MMKRNIQRLVLALLTAALSTPVSKNEARAEAIPQPLSITTDGAVLALREGQHRKIEKGERQGNWTLMGVIPSGARRHLAVFEDFSKATGSLVIAGENGEHWEFPKTLEPTRAAPSGLYHGHSLEEVFRSERDLLGDETLAKAGDPEYTDVAACFPPISKAYTYTFVGTHECAEKVGVFYGGGTPNFDPAAYVPAIAKIRTEGRVLDGLVGGWLPVLRFVYPEKPGDWTELLIYAPMRAENHNHRVQPVWYRISRIEGDVLRWVRYFDSYHPSPPRTEAMAEPFYEELLAMRRGWNQTLGQGMQIDVPDQRLADLARHSLVREMMTRIGDFPKYGVFDRGYGGSEHDGFPDTFTADTMAMLEWGLFDLARQYLDNYLKYFVRDDGAILYRGPETGQFGRMLTVAATYANYTGDTKLLLRHRHRLDALTKLLLSLRAKALQLPGEDPAFGMIAGWSEADSCLDPDPSRYVKPYFSNSTEAARGFAGLGDIWEKVGTRGHQPDLLRWGQRLREESQALMRDLQTAIARSTLTNTQPACLPAIAGASEPFHVAVARDKLDPQFRSYRAYAEMLYSGNLPREQVAKIVEYRAMHHDIILGIPTAYGYDTHEWAGFLAYGHAYGLLQMDSVREYLLTLYSLAAHHYTRGTWTAPETRNLDPTRFAAPYCSPAQMTVPLLTRWLLVFEDPSSEVLWLAKATPRSWLADGRHIAITNAPTRWGRVGFDLRSHLDSGSIEARLNLPHHPIEAHIKLRLRVPDSRRIDSVRVNGKPWDQFDVGEETVTLPREAAGRVELSVSY